VKLPDDIMYAPALEFVLQDEVAGVESLRRLLGGDSDTRRTVAWGSIPLEDFHPQGPELPEGAGGGADEEADEDRAAMRRAADRRRRRDFRTMLEYLQNRQMIAPEHARVLRSNFERGDERVIQVRGAGDGF
jgi:hypothetical protein